MTMALCFNCGETKFGALCPCRKCSSGTTGDMQLDILFSDHNFSRQTLKEFGTVIQSILKVSNDNCLRFSTFIYYISKNHGDILQIDMEKDLEDKCKELLHKADFEDVIIKESYRATIKNDMDLHPATDEEIEALKSVLSEISDKKIPDKTWWQFWR